MGRKKLNRLKYLSGNFQFRSEHRTRVGRDGDSLNKGS